LHAAGIGRERFRALDIGETLDLAGAEAETVGKEERLLFVNKK
jgi:hypothetical protein